MASRAAQAAQPTRAAQAAQPTGAALLTATYQSYSGEHNSLTTFGRTYMKNQLRGLFRSNQLQDYKTFVLYYIRQCSKFQIEIDDDIIKAVISLNGDKYDDLVYEKKYYNPELVPQQFFMVIKENLAALGRNITDFYQDPIYVTFFTNQIVKVRVSDVEWKLR